MQDSIYVVEMLLKQKQEELEKRARLSWMWKVLPDKQIKDQQLFSARSQHACCPSV